MLSRTEPKHSTLAQERFARVIHNELGVEPPTIFTFSAYASWLDKYVPLYRSAMKERQLQHEADMEAIDARRDW